MQARNRSPVIIAESPVRPPASTPEALSIKVVTVEVPVKLPTTVPVASAIRHSFICFILPFSSSIFALDAVPIKVPIVSNMSIIQNVIISVIAVDQPMLKNASKLNLKSVVADKSANAGTHEAVPSAAKGLISKNINSPSQ